MLTTTPRGLFKDLEALLYFRPSFFAKQEKGVGMKDVLANFRPSYFLLQSVLRLHFGHSLAKLGQKTRQICTKMLQ